MIIEFIVSINKPLRNNITISKHSLNVKTKSLRNFTKEFLI